MMNKMRGFTIVELLVVIVVIAVLAAVSVIAYNGIQSRAARAAAHSDVNQALKQIQLKKQETDNYPVSISDCPTPSSDSLCLQASYDGSYLYQTSTASNLPDFQLSSMNDKHFYYVSNGEVTGGSEFLRYGDVAPYIDQFGLVDYKLEFDLKSLDTSANTTMRVYMQNGSNKRYGNLSQLVDVSTEYQHYEISYTPSLVDENIVQSHIAFYGNYGTGNIPVVKNLTFTLAD